MPRRKKAVPNYSHHKPTGQAYVRFVDGLGGRRTVYLGPYDSPESRREYARVVAELATTPAPAAAPTPAGPTAGHAVTVNEVLLAFWRHAERHYRRPDGTPTDELAQYRQTFRLVKELYGHTPAAEFGPRALKSLRQRMIDVGWTRKLVNQRVGRVRRVFKWAAAEERLPVSVFQALGTLPGLQAGRTEARETDPIEPVAEEHVGATLPHLRPAVAAMVRVQLLTGMRPGEVCQLRPCDLDTSGAVWLFRPVQYKTRHRNKPRVVAVGPRAQAVLAAFTPADPGEFYFSPRRVVEQLHAERAANRKTPRYASHMTRNRTKRVAAPAKRPAARYTVTSYGRAVGRAVVKANGRRARLSRTTRSSRNLLDDSRRTAGPSSRRFKVCTRRRCGTRTARTCRTRRAGRGKLVPLNSTLRSVELSDSCLSVSFLDLCRGTVRCRVRRCIRWRSRRSRCPPGGCRHDQHGSGKDVLAEQGRTAVLALRDLTKPIGVAGFETRLVESLPEELEGKLPTVEALQAELGKLASQDDAVGSTGG